MARARTDLHASPGAAYRLAVLSSHGLVRGLGMRLRVTGAEHLPDDPCVVAFQHCAPVDGVVLGGLLDRLGHRSTVLLKASVFRTPVVGPLLRAGGAVPVARFVAGGADDTLALSRQRLAEGRSLLIAPEGGLSRSFTVMPMRTGAARLAAEAGVPIVPVVQVGLQRLGGVVDQPFRPRRGLPVDVRFGAPITPSGDARSDTDRLHGALTELLDEAFEGYPEPGVGQWWWPQSRGGDARGHQDEAARHAARFRGVDVVAGEA